LQKQLAQIQAQQQQQQHQLQSQLFVQGSLSNLEVDASNSPGTNNRQYPVIVNPKQTVATLVQKSNGSYVLRTPEAPSPKISLLHSGSPVPVVVVPHSPGTPSRTKKRTPPSGNRTRDPKLNNTPSPKLPKLGTPSQIVHAFSVVKRFWVLFAERCDPNEIIDQMICKENAQKGMGTPAAFIQRLWDKGYKVRQVLYAQQTWVVLADKRAIPYDRKQGLTISAQFPKKKIASVWRSRQRVTYLGFTDNLWILITEQREEGDSGQRMATKRKLTKKDIENFWAEGYKLHIVTYGGGQWVLIGDKCEDPTQTQTFYYSTDFPEKKIEEYYRSGKRIHTICYSPGEDLWAVILDNYISNDQTLYIDTQFPHQKLREIGVLE